MRLHSSPCLSRRLRPLLPFAFRILLLQLEWPPKEILQRMQLLLLSLLADLRPLKHSMDSHIPRKTHVRQLHCRACLSLRLLLQLSEAYDLSCLSISFQTLLYDLLLICIFFQYGYIRQITVSFSEIDTVSNYESIRYLESYVVYFKINFSSVRLIQQCTYF